MKQINRL